MAMTDGQAIALQVILKQLPLSLGGSALLHAASYWDRVRGNKKHCPSRGLRCKLAACPPNEGGFIHQQ
jgi:hypothetical protein